MRLPTILVVDDEISVVHALSSVLASMAEVRFATSGESALEQIARQRPDLVLLDAHLPGISGLEVCRLLRADATLIDVPVIFITADSETEVAGLDAGAVDFIAKPFRAAVVRARVRTQLRLSELTEALRREANEDALTGLATRRVFDESVRREISRTLRVAAPMTLMLVDVDHFKRFNDSAGHPAGDTALRAVAEVLQSCLRVGDLAARIGGEEFAVLLPLAPLPEANIVAHRVQERLRRAAILHPGLHPGALLTVSMGLSNWHPLQRWHGTHSEPLDLAKALVERADRALYAAKAAGRDGAFALLPTHAEPQRLVPA